MSPRKEYLIAHSLRVEVNQVLDNWDSDSYWEEKKAEKIKVIVDYLDHLKDNIFNFGEKQELHTDFDIVLRIKSKVDHDDREFQIDSCKSSIQVRRAKKQIFKIKVAMLDLLKSLMKVATVLDFIRSLLLIPEECLKSKATTLELCECLNALPLPEELKSWLLQETVESDITSAYDDARESLVLHEQFECIYIMKLREILGAVPEHQEEEEEDILTDDMDSLKKCLKCRLWIKNLTKSWNSKGS